MLRSLRWQDGLKRQTAHVSMPRSRTMFSCPRKSSHMFCQLTLNGPTLLTMQSSWCTCLTCLVPLMCRCGENLHSLDGRQNPSRPLIGHTMRPPVRTQMSGTGGSGKMLKILHPLFARPMAYRSCTHTRGAELKPRKCSGLSSK